MTASRLALTFDDGYAEDYEDLWPVLRERDVPASLSVVSGQLDTPDTLTIDQLNALVDDGWEVMAHGQRHRYLQAHSLAGDAVAGDERVIVESGHVFPGANHGTYPGDEFEVTDGGRAETHVLAETGASEDGATMVFETPLERDFDAEETIVRLTDSQLRDEVVGAKRDLQELGFDPTTFVLPYDAGDPRAWQLVADHYEALANAAVRSLPNIPGTPPLGLQRYYLETTYLRMVEVAEYLDLLVDRGGLGILAGHSAWETVSPERVAAVVDAAFDRGIEVTTVREGTRD